MGWLIDWLIDHSVDWLISGLIDWLIDRSMAWLIDQWVDWLIDWLIDGLIDWLINGLIDWLIGVAARPLRKKMTGRLFFSCDGVFSEEKHIFSLLWFGLRYSTLFVFFFSCKIAYRWPVFLSKIFFCDVKSSRFSRVIHIKKHNFFPYRCEICKWCVLLLLLLFFPP